MTNTKVHKGNETFIIEFPEYKCNKKQNSQRKRAGLIVPGFKCWQLTAHRTLYRDQEKNPIKVEIKYLAGCELRCIDRDCQMHLPVPAVFVDENGE